MQQQAEELQSTSAGASPYSEFRNGWKVVLAAAFGAGCGVTGVMVYSLTLFLTPLSEAFGWSRTEVSAAKTFLTLGFVVVAPFVGYLADRVGARRIGMISLVLLSLAMLAMTQINGDIRNFYLALFLLAIVGGATTPLVWTRAVATWFHKKRGLALGITLTGTGVAGVISPPIIGTLIDTYGWQAGYIGLATIALVALLPISLFFFEYGQGKSAAQAASAKRPAPTASGVTVREALMTRHFWQIGLGFALVGAVVSSLVVHLVPLLTDSGLERSTAARIASLLAASVIGGRLWTGYLVDKFPPPVVAGAFLIAPVIGMLLLAGDPVFGLVILAAITFGLAAGSEVDLVPFLTARYFGLKAYGRIYGSIFVLFYLGVGAGPPLFGYMYDLHGNYSNALKIGAVVLTVGVLSITLLGRPLTQPATSLRKD